MQGVGLEGGDTTGCCSPQPAPLPCQHPAQPRLQRDSTATLPCRSPGPAACEFGPGVVAVGDAPSSGVGEVQHHHSLLEGRQRPRLHTRRSSRVATASMLVMRTAAAAACSSGACHAWCQQERMLHCRLCSPGSAAAAPTWPPGAPAAAPPAQRRGSSLSALGWEKGKLAPEHRAGLPSVLPSFLSSSGRPQRAQRTWSRSSSRVTSSAKLQMTFSIEASNLPSRAAQARGQGGGQQGRTGESSSGLLPCLPAPGQQAQALKLQAPAGWLKVCMERCSLAGDQIQDAQRSHHVAVG